MDKTQKAFTPIVIVILLIIFIAAAAAIGTVYVLKKNAESNLPPPAPAAVPESSSAAESEGEKDCDKIPEQRIRDGCYLNMASTNQDPSACGKIPDPDQKDTCYLAVVADNQDLSICDKIKNQESRGYCLKNPKLFLSKPPNPTSLLSKWKIYINEKQKYSFRYPSEWVFQVTFSDPTASKINAIREEISNRNNYNWNWSMRIAVWDNPASLPLADWLKTIHEPGGLIPKNIPAIPNAVAGKAKTAAVETWVGGTTWDRPGKCVQACPTLDFYFVRKDKAYRVELEGTDTSKKESQKIFRQILSTFEFID